MRLSHLVAVAVLLPVCSAGAAKPMALQDEAVATWVAQNYESVLGLVLPLECEPRPDTVEWTAAARVLSAFEPESLVRLEKRYDGVVSGELIVPKNRRAIREQLGELRRQHPQLSAEQLADLIAVSHLKSGSDDPRLAALARDLEGLAVPTRLPDALVMDGTTFELCLEYQYGSRLLVVLSNPNKADSVRRWVETAHRVFQTVAPGLSSGRRRVTPPATSHGRAGAAPRGHRR